MNDDMLDQRIRTLVAQAVAAAPEPIAPEHLGVAPLVTPSPAARRRWWPTVTLVASAAAAVVGVLLLRTADNTPVATDPPSTPPVTAPATTPDTAPATTPTTITFTTAPSWVSGVASPSWPVYGKGFVTAGPDGVWEFIDGGAAVQWSDQPAVNALKAPDGSMLVQRGAYGTSESTTPDDTVPMVITAPMATPVALQAGLEPGYYVMHDAVRLTDGHDVLLLEWNSPGPADPQNGVYPYRRVVAVDLASKTVSIVIPDEVSLESSVLRLHLTSTGIAVGEQGSSGQTGMVVAPLPGLSFTPQALTFESLGLDYAYDYGYGPTGYTIDTSGTVAAWVDAGNLVLKPTSGPDAPATTIPLSWWNERFVVTDVDINGSIALVSGRQGTSNTFSMYMVVLATGESVVIGEGAAAVTLVP